MANSYLMSAALDNLALEKKSYWVLPLECIVIYILESIYGGVDNWKFNKRLLIMARASRHGARNQPAEFEHLLLLFPTRPPASPPLTKFFYLYSAPVSAKIHF